MLPDDPPALGRCNLRLVLAHGILVLLRELLLRASVEQTRQLAGLAPTSAGEAASRSGLDKFLDDDSHTRTAHCVNSRESASSSSGVLRQANLGQLADGPRGLERQDRHLAGRIKHGSRRPIHDKQGDGSTSTRPELLAAQLGTYLLALLLHLRQLLALVLSSRGIRLQRSQPRPLEAIKGCF